MCIWRHDGGEADRTAIDLMLAPIAHRGPDGKGVWQNGRVALGHFRLSIIDLTEASGQPILTADGLGALELWARIFFAGVDPAALSNKLIALAADDTSRKPLERGKRKGRSGLSRLARRSVGSLKSLPAKAVAR